MKNENELNQQLASCQTDLHQAKVALGLALLRGQDAHDAHQVVSECERSLLEAESMLAALHTFNYEAQTRAEQARMNKPTMANRNEMRAKYDACRTEFKAVTENQRTAPAKKEDAAVALLRAAKGMQTHVNDASKLISEAHLDLDKIKGVAAHG